MLSKAEIASFALHNDEYIFTESDLKPFDDIILTGRITDLGSLCNIRGLSVEQLVKDKLSKIFCHLYKPTDMKNAMDLYDPVMRVRIEIKYENSFTKVTIDKKFGIDSKVDIDGANLYLYINLGCKAMPTIRHYHTNMFIINGRRLTWDLLYGIYLEANALLSPDSDSTLTLLRKIDWIVEKRRFDEAVKQYVENHSAEIHEQLEREIQQFATATAELNKIIDHYRTELQCIQSNPLGDTCDVNFIQESTLRLDIESEPINADDNGTEHLTSQPIDIITQMIMQSKTVGIKTEMDAFNYLINIPFIQKLLCEYGCVKEYFYNRLTEICTANNIECTYKPVNILNIFGKRIRKGYRQFIINDNGQRIETSNEAVGYTTEERARVQQTQTYNSHTDLSAYFNSPELMSVLNRATESAIDITVNDYAILDSMELIPTDRFVRVDNDTNATGSIKAKNKRTFLLQMLKTYSTIIGFEYPGRENSCVRYTNEHGGSTVYNMQSVFKNLYKDDPLLFKAINDRWFDLRAYDKTLSLCDKLIRSIEVCIKNDIQFKDYRAAFGERGTTDLHHKLCEILKNHGKTKRNASGTPLTSEERVCLESFIIERLRVIDDKRLAIKRNATTGKNENCIPMTMRMKRI